MHALARRDAVVPGRPVHRDHGPVGLRQVHADAPARRARQARPRAPSCVDGQELAGLDDKGAHAAAARPPRLRLPGLQPRAGADRRGEHHAAAHARRPQARPGVARHADRRRRPRATASRTARPSSPAASSSASPWRARSIHRPAVRVRRRADRQPGLASPPTRCSACCARPSTSSARRWSWSPTTPHAASVADRIVVLRDGEVVHDGAGDRRPRACST